jgi:virulence-associated protein VapD
MKIEVTQKYLENTLQALKDAKGLCQAYGFKNSFGKNIKATEKYIEKGVK